MSATRVRLIQFGLLTAIVGIAEWAARAGAIKQSILPAPPSRIIERLWNEVAHGEIWPHAWTSAQRVLLAFAIAAVLGFLLGIVLWRVPLFAVAFEPVIASSYAIPWIAFYPILLVLMGLGDGPIILIAAVLGLVPLALNTFIGLQEIRPVHLKVGRVHRLSRLQVLRKIMIPDAIPYIVSGLKLGFLYCYLGVIGTEFLQSTQGLGFLVNTSYFYFDDVGLYAFVLFIVLITLVLFFGLDRVEHRIGRRFK